MEIRIQGVELDYSNLYEEVGEPVVFSATIIVEAQEDELVVVSAIAEEPNEIFGVEEGELFDPGDSIDVDQLVKDYPELFEEAFPALSEVLTASEADTKWGLPVGTVKKVCNKQIVSKTFYGHEARKAGGTWLVTRSGMRRMFGEPKE